MIERVARALCIKAGADPDSLWTAPENGEPSLVTNTSRAGGSQWPAWRWWVPSARAAMTAMKYVDGTDEANLITVSNEERVEAVSLIMAWDGLIDAALADD